MELILYRTIDDENVINKDLEYIHTMNIVLKSNVSIVSPIIILKRVEGVDLFSSNYCYLDELNRYYFIREIEIMNNDNVRMMLECDVLESFKQDILNSVSEVNRNMKHGDYHSTSVETDVRKTTNIYKSDVSVEGERTIVLTTIGGV